MRVLIAGRRLPGAFFFRTFLRFPAFFFGGCGVREDADAWRQSLLLAFLFSFFNAQVRIVGVFQALLVAPSLLPEPALIVAFMRSQSFDEIGVHASADFFDFVLGALQCVFAKEGKLPHTAQGRDDVIDTLVQQERAFVDT
jgi:hypothetical protein